MNNKLAEMDDEHCDGIISTDWCCDARKKTVLKILTKKLE